MLLTQNQNKTIFFFKVFSFMCGVTIGVTESAKSRAINVYETLIALYQKFDDDQCSFECV